MVVTVQQPATLGLAMVLALAAALATSVSLSELLRRLVPLNCFMVLVLLVAPLSAAGPALATFGPIAISRDGLATALAIAVKGNAIVLVLVVLVASLDTVVLGHALAHLHVPAKLTHLFLFTLRYLEVLQRQYRRLHAAARLRGFRPGMNRHTYRTYGYLVGMLLVRSLDRSERILAAMKCRGFRGQFYLLDHFAFSRYDAGLAAMCVIVLLTLAGVEWL